jgi:hypothetical protein
MSLTLDELLVAFNGIFLVVGVLGLLSRIFVFRLIGWISGAIPLLLGLYLTHQGVLQFKAFVVGIEFLNRDLLCSHIDEVMTPVFNGAISTLLFFSLAGISSLRRPK